MKYFALINVAYILITMMVLAISDLRTQVFGANKWQ